ncbi:MAG: DUF4157 domain-containing protein [Thermoanaerobaculia bacterium]
MAGKSVAETMGSQLVPVFGGLVARARLHSGLPARLLAGCLGADAFVLGRRVFLSPRAADALERRSGEALALLAHELTHVAQYRRLGFLPFLTRYLREYLRLRWAGRDHGRAYREISFEREAMAAERALRGS